MLYHVKATIEVDMAIVADTEEEAVRLGHEYWSEEATQADLQPSVVTACQVVERSQLDYLDSNDVEHLVPWGGDHPVEHYLTLVENTCWARLREA